MNIDNQHELAAKIIIPTTCIIIRSSIGGSTGSTWSGSGSGTCSGSRH